MIFIVLAFLMMGAEVTALVHENHKPLPGSSHSYSEVNQISSYSHSQSWDQENLKRNDNPQACGISALRIDGLFVECQ